jgi:hypothetical protein
MTQKYCKIVDALVAARGEKKGYYFVGDITTKEVLEKLGLPIVKVNHTYAYNTIKAFYPQSSFGKYSEEEGYDIHVRVRTK